MAYGRKPGRKAGHYRTVDRMLINLGMEGKTGKLLSTYYDRKKKRYAPNPRDLVAGMVSADQPGW